MQPFICIFRHAAGKLHIDKRLQVSYNCHDRTAHCQTKKNRREHISDTTKQDFRIKPEEKEELQSVADYIVRSGERGQRGATKAVMFGWLCSGNPELLRRLGNRLIEYADMLERRMQKNKKEEDTHKEPRLDNESLVCA
jgi:nitrous oxide reductase accessory protein NosL